MFLQCQQIKKGIWLCINKHELPDFIETLIFNLHSVLSPITFLHTYQSNSSPYLSHLNTFFSILFLCLNQYLLLNIFKLFQSVLLLLVNYYSLLRYIAKENVEKIMKKRKNSKYRNVYLPPFRTPGNNFMLISWLTVCLIFFFWMFVCGKQISEKF